MYWGSMIVHSGAVTYVLKIMNGSQMYVKMTFLWSDSKIRGLKPPCPPILPPTIVYCLTNSNENASLSIDTLVM